MNSEINIVVADDHPIVRKGICQVIAQDPTLKVIAEAGDGEMALTQIQRLRPAIAVLDVEMPKLDGFGLVRELQKSRLPVEVVFLTLHREEDLFEAAMELLVKGYLLKESAASEIIHGIKAVAAGQHYVSPALTSYLLQRRQHTQTLAKTLPELSTLSLTEHSIVQMIADYKSSKEIAEELFIHYRTVENHRTNICQKLGIRGHNALLKFALQHKAEIYSA